MEKIRANIPEKYLENRDTIEGRLILAFWKQPELLDEYKLNPKDDLVNEDSRLLYNLAVKMYESGIIEFDLVSVETYLEKYPRLLEEINENGGVKELIRSANTINTVNIENYYDDLLKANYLIDLYFTQKQLVSDFDKMKNMTDSLCVADYVEHLVGECASSKIMKKVEVNELYISDQLLDEIIQGELIETISFAEYAPKLNDIVFGLPLGMTFMVSAPSGNGKSNFITSMMIYPAIKQGEIVTLISNELGYKQYLIMLITMVLTRELDYYKITRDKILKAKLTAEDIEKLKEAQAFINNNYKGGIKFINYNSSDIDIVIRNMKKYARLGSRVVVYDTMKSPNSANERAWADIIEASKLLTYTCQETNQALILSYQIAMHASTKRFLTGADLSQGKQIKEMITNHIIFRYLKPDEYSGERYDVKPYRWKREETSGKTYKEYFKTDPDKRYIVVYVEKTRNGEDGKHLLYRFDGHHATYTELGYCTVVPD